jgi:2-hydroxy-6-oxonona-2,4-dienedioate hydrolase
MIRIALTDLLAGGPRRLLGTFEHYLRHPLEERLPRVEAPALLVRGTRDALVPRLWAKRTADLLPHGRLVEVRSAAHVMNLHAPERLARLMRRCLGLAPAPAGSAG